MKYIGINYFGANYLSRSAVLCCPQAYNSCYHTNYENKLHRVFQRRNVWLIYVNCVKYQVKNVTKPRSKLVAGIYIEKCQGQIIFGCVPSFQFELIILSAVYHFLSIVET